MAVNMGNAVGYLDLDIAAFTAALAEAQQNANSASKQMSKAFETASKEIGKIGTSISNVGKTLSLGLTTPIVGGVTASVKVLATFEQTMSRVKALSGATGDELDKLSEKAQEMGAKTKYSANDAAEAFTYMAHAGWDTEKMLSGIDGVMNLAASDGIALADASSIVTSSLTGFGLAASDAAHFADVLAVASSASNTDVQSLGESFKYVAPVAGAAGYSIEDVATALGVMANNGIVAGQAGTSLRSIISRLSAPTKLSAEYMEQLGISVTNADGSMKTFDGVIENLRTSFGSLTTAEQMFYASEIFGQEAMTGVLALINTSVDEYGELESAIYDSEGAAQAMAETMQDNLLGRLEELSSAVESIAMSVGEILMPTIEKVVAKLQEWADYLNNLSDEQKETIVQVGLFVAAIGPALAITGKIVSGFGTLVSIVGKVTTGFSLLSGATVAISAPILAVVAAIGTLAAAFATLWNNNESFRLGIIESWNNLKTVFAQFINDITGSLNILGINWETVTSFLSELWNGFCNALAPIFTTVWSNITIALSTVLNTLSSLFGIFASAFTGDWEGVWNNVGKLFYSIGQGIWKTGESIFNGINQLWNNFIGPFQGAWETAWNGIAGFFSDVFGAIADIFSGVIKGIMDGITYVIQAVGWVGELLGSDVWAPALQEWAKETREGFEVDIAGAVTQGIDKVGTTIKEGVSGFSDYFNAGWETVSGQATITSLEDTLKGELDQMAKDLEDSSEEVGTSIIEGIDGSLQTADGGSLLSGDPIEIDIEANTDDAEDDLQEFADNSVKIFGALIDSASEYLSIVQQQFSEATSSIMGLWGAVNDYINQGYEQQIDMIEEQIEASNELYDEQIEAEQERYETELENLKNMLGNKEISDEQYANRKNQLEQQMTAFVEKKNKEKEQSEIQLKQKQNELARKQFEANKATEIANVWINLAAAIMKTYASSGWITGSIYAALLTAAAGVQTAQIAAQQFVPMFAKGGIVDKPTLGIFGENGKEAFVPLERNTEWMDTLAERINGKDGSYGRNNYNITFNSPTTIDEIQASRLMKRTIRDLAEGF